MTLKREHALIGRFVIIDKEKSLKPERVSIPYRKVQKFVPAILQTLRILAGVIFFRNHFTKGRHHDSLSKYQRIVFLMPSANLVSGLHPKRRYIFVGSIAYRKS